MIIILLVDLVMQRSLCFWTELNAFLNVRTGNGKMNKPIRVLLVQETVRIVKDRQRYAPPAQKGTI